MRRALLDHTLSAAATSTHELVIKALGKCTRSPYTHPLRPLRPFKPTFSLRRGDEPRTCLFILLVIAHSLGEANGERYGFRQRMHAESKRGRQRFYGVMVSTLDSESSDPSSNLGRT